MALAVSRLALGNFRNYASLRLECDARPVVLTGPNGAGKTNILEALSFLAPGRGLRRARISDIRFNAAQTDAGWGVWAEILDESGEERTEIGVGQDGLGDRRRIKIDGKAAKTQGQLSERIGVLWLTPQMDRIFQEGAGGRRRFLDRLVLGQDNDHAARAAGYERALRDRVRLLREERTDLVWLAALEERMAEFGAKIASARILATDRLNQACLSGRGPFPAALLEAQGQVEEIVRRQGEAEAALWLKQGLKAARNRDRDAGGALIGPHRSDLLVRHGTKNIAAECCSTGEQKAVLVSILLAGARLQAENRRRPILLLDEVAAHLDEKRREALFDELCAMGAQSWMTGTDRPLFSSLGERGQFFNVEDGRATPTPLASD